jgi:hypothetical protein
MPTDISRMGVLVLIATLFVGISIAIRGGRYLQEEQRRELSVDSPSGPGMAAFFGVLACALFARSFPLYASIAAIALAVLCAHIMLPVFNRPAWPKTARRLLILGNSVAWLGGLSFVLVTAAGVR